MLILYTVWLTAMKFGMVWGIGVLRVFSHFGELWPRGGSHTSLYTNRTREKMLQRGSVGSRNLAPYGGLCILLTNAFVLFRNRCCVRGCVKDVFFYSLVYDNQQKSLIADHGEIRVGQRYQVEIIPDKLESRMSVPSVCGLPFSGLMYTSSRKQRMYTHGLVRVWDVNHQ